MAVALKEFEKSGTNLSYFHLQNPFQKRQGPM
jgi:hypothetical protein